MSARLCSVTGCDRSHHARGYCAGHLARLRRGLRPGGPLDDRRPASLVRRLARRTTYTASGCLVWTGSRTQNGYGQVGAGTRAAGLVLTHRAAYEALVGPIPDGLDLDHLCRTRACWRVDHLEPVSRSTNVARGWEARRAFA